MTNVNVTKTARILHLPLVLRSKQMYAWDARIYHLTEQFSKKAKQYDITIFSPSKEPEPQPPLFGYPAKQFKLIGPSDAYLFSWDLLNAARKESADLIHCHGFNNLVTLTGMLVKKPHQKLILTINSSKASTLFRELMWVPYVMLFQLLAHRVNHFIAVSEYEKERFAKLLHQPLDKFTVIPNGTEKGVIEAIKVKKKKGLVVTTGRLVKNKGFEHVIQTFNLVAQKNKDARLLVLGDGPERKNLEALAQELGIADKVEFAGYIGPERRKEFLTRLKEAEVFVFLSNYESLPLNIVEAVSAHLVCVVSYNSGMAEFADRKEAFGIRKLDDYPGTAQIILDVLEDPKKFVPTKIYTKSWEEVGEETLMIYDKVLKGELK